MPSKLTFIVVTYNHSEAQYRRFVSDLQCQSSAEWNAYILNDGEPNQAFLKVKEETKDDSRIQWLNSPKRYGKFGHPNRQWALQNLELAEYVHFTNLDNQILPPMVAWSTGVAYASKLDLLIFDLVHNYANVEGDGRIGYNVLHCKPVINRIDWCGFIVKSSIAKETGINHTDKTEADGLFIKEMLNWSPNLKWKKLDCVLTIHN